MREILSIEPETVLPDREDVLRLQGIPRDSILPDRIKDLYDRAFSIFGDSLSPRGLIADISHGNLENILTVAGGNIINSVISSLFLKASGLALYIFTLGEEVSDRIADLFDRNDFAMGSMLDSIASASADKGGEYGEQWYLDYLKEKGSAAPDTRILMYSPGYCGWDVTGQKKLFRYLKPVDIGVTLNESSLMTPIKSVSGVLAAGKKEIHYIKEDFDFCRSCTGKNCRERIKRIKEET